MKNQRVLKSLASFILVFAMLFSVLPGNIGLAEKVETTEVKENVAGLKITGFENKSIFDKKDIEIKEKETGLAFVKRVMDENKIEYVDAGGYLTSVDNLAAFDKGQYSGWMTKLNGTMPTVGLGDIEVKKGDVLELFFVQNYNSLFNIGKGQVIVNALEEKPVFTSEFVEYKKDESVLDFTKRVLDENKIEYIDAGGYLTSINKLAAFDKGPNSGWLIKVNDLLPEVGMADIKTEDGIVVNCFFVEDFNKYFGEGGDVEALFTDMDNFKWAKEAVEELALKEIVQGTGDNKFSPKREVTRAEFATMVARLLKLEEVGENKFTDIKETDWFYKNVLALSNKGYIDGRTDGKFDPNGKITRQEIAKIVGNILKENKLGTEDYETLKKFTDYKDIADWAKEGAAATVKEEIVNGSDGKFLPKKNANRAEAATMLFRLDAKIK